MMTTKIDDKLAAMWFIFPIVLLIVGVLSVIGEGVKAAIAQTKYVYKEYPIAIRSWARWWSNQ